MQRRFLRWFYDTLADVLYRLGDIGGWFEQQATNMSYRAADYDPPFDYTAEKTIAIKPWAKYPDLRYDTDNGITLCKRCHIEERRSGRS